MLATCAPAPPLPSPPRPQAGRWYALLNSKYQKHKPELHIAVTMETTQSNPAPQRPTSSLSTCTSPHACGSLGSLHLTHVAPWGHSTSRMWFPGVTPPHTCGSLGSLHLTHVAPWGHSTSRMWLPGVTPPHAHGSLGSLHLTHVVPWGHSTSHMWLPGVTPPHACGSLGSLHLTHVAPWGHSTSLPLCIHILPSHIHPHSYPPPPTPPVSDDPSHLSLVLDEEQGYYVLRPQGAGPQDPGQLDIFIVSLMLSGVKDLLQVCETGVRGEGCGPLHSPPLPPGGAPDCRP